MNRRLTFAAFLVCVPLLASCAVVDFFGPRPDSALVELAQTAQADAKESEDSSYAQLRRTQSEELFAEINRLCGLEEDGQVPDTCVIEDTDPAGPAGSREDAVAQLVELAEKVPEDSRPLLIDQAIALADGDAALPETPDEDMLGEARRLLEFEYSTVYGLDVAEAHGADVDTVAHEELIVQLQEFIGEDAPVADPAYTATWPDDSTAQEFADELVQSSRDSFEAAAVTAKDSQWRSWLIHAAAKL